jgi:hypothetical protein
MPTYRTQSSLSVNAEDASPFSTFLKSRLRRPHRFVFGRSLVYLSNSTTDTNSSSRYLPFLHTTHTTSIYFVDRSLHTYQNHIFRLVYRTARYQESIVQLQDDYYGESTRFQVEIQSSGLYSLSSALRAPSCSSCAGEACSRDREGVISSLLNSVTASCQCTIFHLLHVTSLLAQCLLASYVLTFSL